jgi:hypothetical protein
MFDNQSRKCTAVYSKSPILLNANWCEKKYIVFCLNECGKCTVLNPSTYGLDELISTAAIDAMHQQIFPLFPSHGSGI